jgi:hypothetical protein
MWEQYNLNKNAVRWLSIWLSYMKEECQLPDYVVTNGKTIDAFFFCGAIGTAATPGLLCQPRVIVKMIVEKQMECRLAGETEVLGQKTCPSATFCPSQYPT